MMSRERDLLKRVKILMECSDPEKDSLMYQKAPILIKQIQDLLDDDEESPMAYTLISYDRCQVLFSLSKEKLKRDAEKLESKQFRIVPLYRKELEDSEEIAWQNNRQVL